MQPNAEAKEVPPMTRRGWFFALLCALVAAAAYLSALQAQFVWDDYSVQTLQLPAFSSLSDVLRPPEGVAQWEKSYYRPVVVLTYLAEKKITDRVLGAPSSNAYDLTAPARARLPHAMSLFFHALATGAVTLLARRLFRGIPGADLGGLVAGLVFALHPIHTESVMSVAGRSDSLSTFFLVAALLFSLFGREQENLTAMICSGVLFLLALLSKEVALAGFFILPLYQWVLLPEKESEGQKFPLWLPLACFAGAAAVYGGLRVWGGSAAHLSAPGGLGEAASRFFRASSFYWQKILFPWPPTPYAPELPGMAQTSISVAVVLLLAYLCVRWRHRTKLPLFCLLWFAACLAPSLAVAMAGISFPLVAERYLYLPSVALAVALGGGAAYAASRWKAATLSLCGLVLILYAVASRQAAQLWISDFTLWSYVTKQEAPARYMTPWLNLGMNQYSRGELDEAEQSYRKALSVSGPPANGPVELIWNGFGSLQYRRMELALLKQQWGQALAFGQEAENSFRQAATLDPSNWWYRRNLALARRQQVTAGMSLTRRPDLPLLTAACEDFRAALALSGDNPGVAGDLQECLNFSARAAAMANRPRPK
jgi:tetratricopeptide (TPR) repeat protein